MTVRGGLVRKPKNVAIVGGGASGLAALRIFQKNKIKSTLFEKQSRIGGVWQYSKSSKTNPMYGGLKTNLPREIMGYREKPWCNTLKQESSYMTHRQVLNYLTTYANEFHLWDDIQFDSIVSQITRVNSASDKEEYPQFQVEWENSLDKQQKSDIFDAVCVCNGHYAAPSIPQLHGISSYEGNIIHSMEYDDPSLFTNQNVLCIGGRASGSDLAREISQYCNQVYLSDSAFPHSKYNGKPQSLNNVTWLPRTTAYSKENNGFSFEKSDFLLSNVDTVIFCSGYDYNFPFLNSKSNIPLKVIPGERRVSPLYKQLWHAHYPSLTFVGLQHSILPFPLFELQSEAIAANLLQPNKIPELSKRIQAAEYDATNGGPTDVKRVQNTHYLGSFQWDYMREMATIANVYDNELENYLQTTQKIWNDSSKARKGLFPGGPDTYRYDGYIRHDQDRDFTVFSTLSSSETKQNSIAAT